jgi:hypothetical protein
MPSMTCDVFMKCQADTLLFSYSFLSPCLDLPKTTTTKPNLRTGCETGNVLLIGDFNSYAFEEPITYLLENGFKSLIDLDQTPTPYGYLFDGQFGTLDFAFLMEPEEDTIDEDEPFNYRAKDWRVNADETPFLDYNLDFGKDPDIFKASIPARFSDHDPVVMGVKLGKKGKKAGTCNTDNIMENTGRTLRKRGANKGPKQN